MVSEFERQQNEVKRLLIEGKLTALEIVTKTGAERSGVFKMKAELAKLDTDIAMDSVSSLSPKLVIKMAEKIAKEEPELSKDLSHLANGLGVLEKLEPQVLQAMGSIVTRSHEAIMNEDTKPSEFRMYSELILKTYATLANRGIHIDMTTTNNTVVNNAVKTKLNGLLNGIVEEAE